MALVVKIPPVNAGGVRGTVQSPGREGALEEGTATPSGILAWGIPRTEEPGGYSPRGHKDSDAAQGWGRGMGLSLFGRSGVSDSVIPRTEAHQAPLSMGFSRPEYWRG